MTFAAPISPASIVRAWSANLLAAGGRVADLNGRCGLVVTGEGGGRWIFSCRHPVAVDGGDQRHAVDGKMTVDCEVIVSSEDLVAWAQGDINPQAAFNSGRIRVRGDGVLALRLAEFFGPTR